MSAALARQLGVGRHENGGATLTFVRVADSWDGGLQRLPSLPPKQTKLPAALEESAAGLILRVVVLSYLDRLLDPLTDALTLESATALLNLRADPDVEARVDELRRKSNEGVLTPVEDAEYKDFIEAVDIVSIMQAKARRFLSGQAA